MFYNLKPFKRSDAVNKREANLKSQSGELTVGELRAMIAATKSQSRASRVNPSLTLSQVCDILERALDGRAADEKPVGMRTDVYSGRLKPSKDSLIIRNILRECA